MTAAAPRGRSFDAWADDYDRYRPTYPTPLFELIARELRLPSHPEVADIGAGTGRASIAMAARGWRVTAVEPGSPMLDLLRARAGTERAGITTVQATAESTGLAPASVDLATAAQAFHWFDKPAALAEMARIVRAGGGVALFWNVRDEARSPFVADYHRLLERYGGVAEGKYLQAGRASGREATRAALELAPGWEAVRLVELRHEIAMRADDFMGMAFTASYIRALAPEDQARFGDEVTDLLQRHRSTYGDSLSIPYRVDCWLARRSA